MSETFSVGASVQDHCRPCKMVRRHTIMAAGGDTVRVLCDYCGSQHNYRGGDRASKPAAPAGSSRSSSGVGSEPIPLVSDWERSDDTMTLDGTETSVADLEVLLRRIIREESGLTPVAPAAKWHGGQLILKPGSEGLAEKSYPIETIFRKIVMIRNKIRTLEQQINVSDLPEETKLKIQSYITGCYGSLTSFNILFAEEEDGFHGAGGKD
jgi:ribosomal protein L36